MQSQLHSKEVTTTRIRSISFSFFTDEEIEKISVCQIRKPVQFNSLGGPVPEGLYDPRMGPLEFREACQTCSLRGDCPGHFGHVRLCVPVYNPLVFMTLFKLLRVACLNCFRLRCAAGQAQHFVRRLRLLRQGRLAEAKALGGLGPPKYMLSGKEGKTSAGLDDAFAGLSEAQEADVESLLSSLRLDDSSRAREGALSAGTLEAAMLTVAELFGSQPDKCASCGAFSPPLRREKCAKIFVMPLPVRKGKSNVRAGLDPLARLADLVQSSPGAGEGLEELEGPELSRGAARPGRKAREGGVRGLDAAGEFEDGEDWDVKNGAGLKDDAVDPNNDDAMDLDASPASKSASTFGKPAREHGSVRRAREAAAVDLAAAEEAEEASAQRPRYLTPQEALAVLEEMWRLNGEVLDLVYPCDLGGRSLRRGASPAAAAAAAEAAHRARRGPGSFFLRSLAVAPNRMRPQSVFNGKRFDHPFNTHLLRVLELDSEVVRTRETLERALQDEGAAAGSLVAAGGADPAAGGSSGAARDARTLLRLWLTLQTAVNAVLDSSTVPRPAGQPEVMGIRQTLERKEGLFRSNMMGKRVNFAARSVISPDGYLRGGEIGVPPYIASRLCFPERVTPWNVERLCEAVLAGPGKIPGAFAVEDERGRVLMLRPDRASREAVARRLYGDMRSAGARRASSEASSRGKSLGNPRDPGSEAAAATSAAAPTSRRTSSAAHAELSEFGGCRVVYRCLEDGDALLTNRQPTLHKPGILAHRARIMRGERTIRMHYANCSTFNADFDGDEINLHLPQDHAARAEAYGLVSADAQFCVPTDGKPLRGLIQDHVVAGTLLASRDTLIPRARYASLVLEAVGADAAGSGEVWLDGPAVLKPQALWTGKQVITAVLMHYARDSLPLSFQTATKTPLAAWGARSGEGQLVVQRGHLVAGVLDKHAFGKHGLLHLVHELYGPDRAALLTAALSRLLTAFLQLNGFTCGLADVGLVARAEDARADVLAQAERRCAEAAAQLVEAGHEQGGDASASRLLRKRLGAALRASPDLGAALDMRSSGAMHPLGSEIVKACLPGGAARAFRHNMMSLMTMTGAKGSVVNFSQISCLLGQQELEGRRVPRMSSGASLPCFAPWDAGARAGGFVGDRFLTGLRPQEYYFHCMAGREGLVDTTVKTSRSGYLQRCMVKSLEPLHVAYDGSVRDAADQRIVQFRYGEDGVDPSRVGCLRTLPLFFNNQAQLARRLGLDRREGEGAPDAENAKEAEPRGRADVPAAVRDLLAGAAPGSDAAAAAEAPWGSVSPGFAKMLDEALCGGLLVPPARGREALAAAARGEGSPDAYGAGNPAGFARLMQAWFAACRAAAGESVGVVAAQSIGEPSTQMTLNTFHMAGRGEANVTLGIPRLREILMTASSNLKTPVMTLPLRPGRDAAALAGRLRRLRLAEALGALRVRKRVLVGGVQGTEYVVSLEFHPEGAYPVALGLTWDEIVRCVDGQFRGRLEHAVKLQLRRARARLVGQVGLQERPIGARRRGVAADEGGEDAEDVERPRPVGDGGAGSDEEAEVDEDEETNEEFVEGKMRGQGSRYEEQDEDDARIASLARINEAARRGEVASDDEEGDEEDQPPKAMDGEASELEDDSEASSGEGEAIGCRTQGARLAVERLAKANLTANAAGRTFELTVVLPPGAPRLLVLELAERVAAECTIRGTPGLTKCYVLEAARGQAAAVQTDGINLAGAWAHSDLVDVDAIATNSPAVMLKNYGVEAARAAIVREVSTVFGAYGIGVDNRHLNLIADAMTQLGGYRPCSRLGIAASASPLLKVTFETATAFLVAATLHGHSDSLGAPAASIIVGQPVRLGTGSFGIMHQV